MKKIPLSYSINIGLILWLLMGCSTIHAQKFSTKLVPSVSKSITANMDIRYYTELLGTSSAKGIEKQFAPLQNTDITTVVCAPMSWRFYNYPSSVDLTWKEPNLFPRATNLYPAWNNMIKNLQNGGDPLKDALTYTRKIGKRFVVNIRMNDSHYIYNPLFPTHNNFWRSHPEYKLGSSKITQVTDTSAVFNYLVPEVRDFYFKIIEEICTNYDVDGIELDFQRAPIYFHQKDIDTGRPIMTDYVKRIRDLLTRIGKQKNKQLELNVRALQTVKANYDIGLDVLNWDKAGLISGITVSPHYINTTDVGIEEFVAKRKNARIFGEINSINYQRGGGTGHEVQDRRYVSPENYRAAILSFLERGADGISFFNTYTIPAASLKVLSTGLLSNLKDINKLKQADKVYSTYANNGTMFGKIFPAKDEATYEVYIADDIRGNFKNAVIRFETNSPNDKNEIEAWINGTKLQEYQSENSELFSPIIVTTAYANKKNLRFFTIPLSALKFGSNQVHVKNLSRRPRCTFISSELALYANAGKQTQ